MEQSLARKRQLSQAVFDDITKKIENFNARPGNCQELYFELKLFLKNSADLDLTNYRDSYLKRRIYHRLTRLNLETYEKYLQFCKIHPEEVQFFKQDLTIHTTEFFRDKSPFQCLGDDIIPELIEYAKSSGKKRIRILSSPCSTGQEPYSLVILLEQINKIEKLGLSFEIFACDVEPQAIEKAKKGIYTDKDLRSIPPCYLDQYFTELLSTDPNPIMKYYELSSYIRNQVHFFSHDLFKPLPSLYRNMDLVLCRNLLIYISKSRQVLVIENLRDVINDGGFLMLGKTESLMLLPVDGFKTRSSMEHIYQKSPENSACLLNERRNSVRIVTKSNLKIRE